MLRPRLIIHVVADLEKSIAFYREGLCLQVASGPAPLTGSTLLHRVCWRIRAPRPAQATLTIPGSNLCSSSSSFRASRARRSRSGSTTPV